MQLATYMDACSNVRYNIYTSNTYECAIVDVSLALRMYDCACFSYTTFCGFVVAVVISFLWSIEFKSCSRYTISSELG